MSVELLNQVLGFGTLAMQIVTVGLIAALVLRKQIPGLHDVVEQAGRAAFGVGFVLALVASVLTLYYSEILGFDPCPLCWWQRVFLYPQVILFALALFVRKSGMGLAATVLSVLGLGVALYHHALQMLPSGTLPCPATGPSCAQITFLEYGYITYPLMAATLFALIIVLMLSERAVNRQ